MIFYIMFVFWVGREKYAQIFPHFLSIIFLLKLFFRVGQGGGSGIPVYPKKIRQNTKKYAKFI